MKSSTILLNQRRSEIAGKKTYKAPTYKLTKEMKERIDRSPLTLDSFISMEQFATYLPRGYRRLKLNMPELRDELLSKRGMNQGTDTNGLRSGGKAAMSGNKKAPPKKATQELTQKTILYNIKNKNKLASNPNPTSFKNKVKL
jgi:hypothetical protein